MQSLFLALDIAHKKTERVKRSVVYVVSVVWGFP